MERMKCSEQHDYDHPWVGSSAWNIMSRVFAHKTNFLLEEKSILEHNPKPSC